MKNNHYNSRLKRFKKLSADLQLLMQNGIFNTKRFLLIAEIKTLFQSLRFYFSVRRLKRILGLCGLLFVLETGTVEAQIFQFADEAQINPYNMDFSTNETDSTFAVPISSFVDIDNDGDMDIIAVDAFIYENEPRIDYFLHENIGTAALPDFGTTPVELNITKDHPELLATRFSPCDIDGDGDLDLLSYGLESYTENYSYESSLVFVENTGTKDAPILEKVEFDPFNIEKGILSNIFIETKDLDEDGDIDIISIFPTDSVGSFIGMLENTGTATEASFDKSPTPLIPPITEYFNGIIQAIDVDDDGDLDLVHHDYGYLNVAYNNGDMTFEALQKDVGAKLGVPEEFNYSYSGGTLFYSFFTTFADLDADGDLDLMGFGAYYEYSSGEEETYTGGILFLENLSYALGEEEATISPTAITLFPNPCTDQLQITLEETLLDDLSTRAGIYDIQGRLVQEVYINQNHQSVDVSDLSAGWYQIRLSTTNESITQPFIKE